MHIQFIVLHLKNKQGNKTDMEIDFDNRDNTLFLYSQEHDRSILLLIEPNMDSYIDERIVANGVEITDNRYVEFIATECIGISEFIVKELDGVTNDVAKRFISLYKSDIEEVVCRSLNEL